MDDECQALLKTLVEAYRSATEPERQYPYIFIFLTAQIPGEGTVTSGPGLKDLQHAHRRDLKWLQEHGNIDIKDVDSHHVKFVLTAKTRQTYNLPHPPAPNS
jgi:hypothetical protein